MRILQMQHHAKGKESASGELIEKWYRKLSFPQYFDEEFYGALKKIAIPDTISADNYDENCQDGKRNLLTALFLAEKLSELYQKKGLSEDVLLDSLQDVLTYTHIFSDLKNELALGRMDWILKILKGEIICFKRLQFSLELSLVDIPEKGVKTGDKVLRCYIPRGGKLTQDSVRSSMEKAKEFFGDFTVVVTSWLLDDSLAELLPQNSNILTFQTLFETVKKEESDAILRFVFRWNTNRFNVKFLSSYNDFSANVKQAVLSGKKF